jgi:hypothetical protein
MQMAGMDHFAIADKEYHDRFQDLAILSTNLDKDDFLDSSYFVDENTHPEKGSREGSASARGASSSKKGKERASSPAREPVEEEGGEEVTVNPAGGLGEDPVWNDPVIDVLDGCPLEVLESDNPPECSQMGGSSASAGMHQQVTPTSDNRLASKRRRIESPKKDQVSEVESLRRLFYKERRDNEVRREEDRKSSDKRREEDKAEMKDFMKNMVQSFLEGLTARPLQMISPTPSSQQLLLDSQPHPSADSAKNPNQSPAVPEGRSPSALTPDSQPQNDVAEVEEVGEGEQEVLEHDANPVADASTGGSQ